MSMKQVLIIEDHQDIANLVKLHLADIQCAVTWVTNGHEGLLQAMSKQFDLIILDLMLPGLDGLSICRQIRTHSAYTPILMLTSKSSESDRVLGLEVGADDYLIKPFSILELIARVKAIFRRIDALNGTTPFNETKQKLGELIIHVEKHEVYLGNKSIDLTAKEFELLLQFARHPGRVYSRAQLLDLVWGYGHDGYEHTVNSHINRLRGKIEQDPAHPEYILTVWGVGYKFNDSLIA